MEAEKERKWWQISAGDGERFYVDVCIDLGVILTGPAVDKGPFTDKFIWEKMKEAGATRQSIESQRRFYSSISSGDIVALKTGREKIYAVGIVVGEYFYSKLFSDVDGWALQHVRMVDWRWTAKKDEKSGEYSPMLFKKNDFEDKEALKIGTTLGLKPAVVEEIKKRLPLVDFNKKVGVDKLQSLPEVPKTVTQEEIAEYLFSKGTSDNSIENLISAMDELRTIAKWYDEIEKTTDKVISENETKTYLIIPLLRALGWTPQKMAIEWKPSGSTKRMDIAIFNQLPRDDENIIAIVEAKRKGNASLAAYQQALEYAKGKKNCNRLIVSDGIRYGVFIKKKGKFVRYAYMNITDFKESYPIYGDCKGIKEALWAMSPDWMNDASS